MAGRIPDRDIAAIRERTRIEDIVGEHVQLRRAGADSLDELRARSKRGIGDDERRLRLSGWAE